MMRHILMALKIQNSLILLKVLIWLDKSKQPDLSEDFIREFKDGVDWHYISQYRTLSESFIRDVSLFINFKALEFNDKIICFSQSFMDDFKDKFSQEFYNKNAEKLSKVCTLQRHIKEYLYAPGGRLYLKTKQHFENIIYS